MAGTGDSGWAMGIRFGPSFILGVFAGQTPPQLRVRKVPEVLGDLWRCLVVVSPSPLSTIFVSFKARSH